MNIREMNYEVYIGERCSCCVMSKGYKANDDWSTKTATII